MYPQVFGKYVLERELARGGMARVMLATLRGAGGFEKRLVVKQIRDELACDDEFVARFVEEAKTAVALAHPNIVPVYELGVELGTYFLTMELIEGASLSELLRAAPNGLSPEEGAYVGVEVCSALDYAHRRMNMVHRDITPRNVMIDEEGHVKVIDFGIAAPVAKAPGGRGVFGSPGHMPPEQMQGGQMTPATDVFAVSVLLMEAWSGKAPFRRKTEDAVAEAMRSPHPKPSDANIRLLPLDEIIASSLSLDWRARPQQADDLGRVLRRFLAGIDLGDLARQIGDRVLAFRALGAFRPAEQMPILQRPASRPTGAQIATKTFAAREELRSMAPEGDGSTRRIASIVPDRQSRRSDAHAVPASTPDARPTPVAKWQRRQLAWVLAFGATGVGAGALFWSARATTPRQSPVHEAAPSPAPPSADLVKRESPAATASITLPDPTTAPPVRSDPARLLLLGDGTQVQVDGVSYGACPRRVPVPPGTHSVLFNFPATGESRSQALTVRAGEHATLRADFTGAAPVVRVER